MPRVSPAATREHVVNTVHMTASPQRSKLEGKNQEAAATPSSHHAGTQAPPTNRQNRPRATLHQNNKHVIDPDLLHSGVTLTAVYRAVCQQSGRQVK